MKDAIRDLVRRMIGEDAANDALAEICAQCVAAVDEGDVRLRVEDKAIIKRLGKEKRLVSLAPDAARPFDPAIMRRFTFKLEFDYLDDAGKVSFFERMFKTQLAEEDRRELATIQNLAPGDFRTVRQESFYLGDEQSNMDRIAALKEECALKKDGNKSAKIGFGV